MRLVFFAMNIAKTIPRKKYWHIFLFWLIASCLKIFRFLWNKRAWLSFIFSDLRTIFIAKKNYDVYFVAGIFSKFPLKKLFWVIIMKKWILHFPHYELTITLKNAQLNKNTYPTNTLYTRWCEQILSYILYISYRIYIRYEFTKN